MARFTNEEIYFLKKVISNRQEWFDRSNFFNPTGTILPFAGKVEKRANDEKAPKLHDPEYKNIPEGWLFCDGRILLDDQPYYNELALILGDNWGESPFNKFRLPDLRGQFLRGVTNNEKLDPDFAERFILDQKNKRTKSTGVGSYQDDSYENHKHDNGTFATVYPPSEVKQKYGSSGKAAKSIPDSLWKNIPNQHTGWTSNEGDSSETRSKNVYVNWIIKI